MKSLDNVCVCGCMGVCVGGGFVLGGMGREMTKEQNEKMRE